MDQPWTLPRSNGRPAKFTQPIFSRVAAESLLRGVAESSGGSESGRSPNLDPAAPWDYLILLCPSRANASWIWSVQLDRFHGLVRLPTQQHIKDDKRVKFIPFLVPN